MRFALLLVLLSAPEAHAASSAKKLTAYEIETFYFLGEEDFESFTCSVQVDLLTNMIQLIHSQFAAFTGVLLDPRAFPPGSCSNPAPCTVVAPA